MADLQINKFEFGKGGYRIVVIQEPAEYPQSLVAMREAATFNGAVCRNNNRTVMLGIELFATVEASAVVIHLHIPIGSHLKIVCVFKFEQYLLTEITVGGVVTLSDHIVEIHSFNIIKELPITTSFEFDILRK